VGGLPRRAMRGRKYHAHQAHDWLICDVPRIQRRSF
jgi:hypothetical protein